MPSEPLAVEYLVELLTSYRFRHQCESSLESGICQALDEAKITYRRQPQLTPRDRPDLLIGHIAVEIKIKGPRTAVVRQLWRYAKIEEVGSILLVTTRNAHRNMPSAIKDKPVRVLYLRPL